MTVVYDNYIARRVESGPPNRRVRFRKFGRFPQLYGELYVVSVDGSSPAIRLTEDKWEDSVAFWGGRQLGANPNQTSKQ
jgi:hypothetical protein